MAEMKLYKRSALYIDIACLLGTILLLIVWPVAFNWIGLGFMLGIMFVRHCEVPLLIATKEATRVPEHS